MVTLISLVEERMTKIPYPILNLDRWQYGKKYVAAMEGELLVGRERNVKLGEVRAFMFSEQAAHDTPVLFFAEREFKSIIPFRAPVIWWRKLK